MNNFDEIEKCIINILKQIPKEAADNEWPDRKWTEQIIFRLTRLCKEKYSPYQVCTSKSASQEADWQGWLYDMSWLLMENNYLIAIPLVLECEWREVDPDFKKLLQSRAIHRIMIFQDSNANKILEIIKWFKESIIKYKDTCIDDRYLFAGYNIKERKFEFELFSPRLIPLS